MKIAYYNLTTTTKHGGVESFVWEVARRAAEAGHAVTLFGGVGPIDRGYSAIHVRRYPFIARERWGRSRVLRRSLNLLKLLERWSMARHALPDLLRGNYDLIQLSKPYDFPVAALARRRGVRVVYNAQGTDFFAGDRWFRGAIDRAFGCSQYNATMVARHFGFPVGVSYNGFDAERFRPEPADSALRARLSPDGAPVALYVGRLVTFKGLDHLLDALALLRQHGRTLPQVVLAGDGPHGAALQQRARRLGIDDRVQFVGSQPNHTLPAWHAASDMLVLPSTDHETFGIAACEAMGCGRPVIAARTGGLPEVVRHEATGLLVEPANAAALADALERLADDAALRARYGAAAAEWVRTMFTWDHVLRRVWQFYDEARA
jgi:glycosyltransferase involved in cell wall biosynthesis